MAFIACPWTYLGKLAQHLGLIVAMGDVQRSGDVPRQPRLVQRLEPHFAAAKRQLVHFARALADRPDHAEITNRSAGCGRTSLEEHDRMPTARGHIGARQPKNPSAHHSDFRATHSSNNKLFWLNGDDSRRANSSA